MVDRNDVAIGPPTDTAGRAHAIADQILSLRHANGSGLQIVVAERLSAAPPGQRGLYEDTKDLLIAAGMQPAEVRPLDGDPRVPTADNERLLDECRSGAVSVLFTGNPGPGRALHVGAVAVHHLDPPRSPGDLA